MSVAPVLVFAIGNESRGDDALGPVLARRLAEVLDPRQVEVLEEYQLQVENTLDMAGRQLVLFLDAGHGTPPPFTFYHASPQTPSGHSTHAVAPEALLGVYHQVNGEAPPPAFILCIAGEAFELGEPLSAAAGQHLTEALGFARALFSTPTLAAWQQRVASQSSLTETCV